MKIIGKQLSRIRFADVYITIFARIITTISLTVLGLKAVNVDITFWVYFLLIIFSIVVFWSLGFFLEKSKIREEDLKLTSRQQIASLRILWREAVLKELIPELEKLISQEK
jgi:hypothetical protein